MKDYLRDIRVVCSIVVGGFATASVATLLYGAPLISQQELSAPTAIQRPSEKSPASIASERVDMALTSMPTKLSQRLMKTPVFPGYYKGLSIFKSPESFYFLVEHELTFDSPHTLKFHNFNSQIDSSVFCSDDQAEACIFNEWRKILE